ncbi:MAG TPA: hypothetical protein VGL38_07140 [bacterium]
MKYSTWIWAGLLIAGSVLADDSRYAMPQPPHGAKQVAIGSHSYFTGVVYIETGSDTSALVPLGFRRFEFESRSVHSVRYHALWPKSALQDSLPSIVSGLEYDVNPVMTPDTTFDLDLSSPSDVVPEADPETPNPNGSGNQ